MRSMICPAEMSLVPPIFSARTFFPSGVMERSSVVPPERCQAKWGLSIKSIRPADQSAAATCPCWWETSWQGTPRAAARDLATATPAKKQGM